MYKDLKGKKYEEERERERHEKWKVTNRGFNNI